jgi:multidrug/hemolysin transport system ATP-binding protein
MAEAIKVKNLVKHYGPTVAVNDISFVVEGASTFAFLGPNGAGKSTTIGCLTTLSSVNSGSVTINGHRIGVDDTKIRRSIGVVFQ